MDTEPVAASAITGFIAATIALLIAFNVRVTDAQRSAILGFIVAAYVLFHVITSWWLRRKVTPLASPMTSDGTPLVPMVSTVTSAPVPSAPASRSKPLTPPPGASGVTPPTPTQIQILSPPSIPVVPIEVAPVPTPDTPGATT